ncbi:MAG: radical SAM protein [Candidatus Helarchaeota archaeon]|nr:radical SAM protein [Candidatus Helarchaeota archaeon]
MQINLSNHTKIKVKAINDQLHLTLSEMMTGNIPKKTFKKLIKKRIRISEKNIQIIKNAEDLIIKIENETNLPVKNVLIKELSIILSEYLPLTLKNKITNRKLIHITKDSGIPLMGSIYFGIIDRGTNLIQVRPLTGCLLNCPFCSVDEGKLSKTRLTDYLITVPYLVEETRKLIAYKGISDIEIHIDGQSEPTLYPHLPELIAEFKKDSRINVISIQTNGLPLNYKYIKKLEQIGLTRINLSINSLNPKKAQYLAGTSSYDIDHIKQIAKQIVSSSIDLLISPLWIPGINDEDIEEIISFTNNLKIESDFPILGIQNYLKYKFGRKISHVKMVNMKRFQEKLREWEEKFETHPLFLSKTDFGIHPAKSYPKPFRKGEKIEVEIVSLGRLPSKHENKQEMLGSAKNRVIQIMNSTAKIKNRVNVKITKTKDNIFYAREIYN